MDPSSIVGATSVFLGVDAITVIMFTPGVLFGAWFTWSVIAAIFGWHRDSSALVSPYSEAASDAKRAYIRQANKELERARKKREAKGAGSGD
ncbi:MAG: hypothetical protein ABFR95_09045 [Actinomycetota bacterium]